MVTCPTFQRFPSSSQRSPPLEGMLVINAPVKPLVRRRCRAIFTRVSVRLLLTVPWLSQVVLGLAH